MIPYFLISLITLVFKFLFSAYAKNDIAENVLFEIVIGRNNPNGGIWFLYTLFEISVIAILFDGKKHTKKIYIITPEQFSYTAEKKLLDTLEDDAVINAEVLTFERMAHRVLTEIEGSNKNSISKSGKAMLIYNILSENKSCTSCLRNLRTPLCQP